jgi:hypothetical protein
MEKQLEFYSKKLAAALYAIQKVTSESQRKVILSAVTSNKQHPKKVNSRKRKTHPKMSQDISDFFDIAPKLSEWKKEIDVFENYSILQTENQELGIPELQIISKIAYGGKKAQKI